MIVGVGLDLTDVNRLAAILEQHGSYFTQRVLTTAECHETLGAPDAIHQLAIRFAAKEACMKALGIGWRDAPAFTDIEVLAQNRGFKVRLAGLAAERGRELAVGSVYLTTTRVGSEVAALVILES